MTALICPSGRRAYRMPTSPSRGPSMSKNPPANCPSTLMITAITPHPAAVPAHLFQIAMPGEQRDLILILDGARHDLRGRFLQAHQENGIGFTNNPFLRKPSALSALIHPANSRYPLKPQLRAVYPRQKGAAFTVSESRVYSPSRRYIWPSSGKGRSGVMSSQAVPTSMDSCSSR